MRLTSFAVKGVLAFQDREVVVNAAALPPGLIAIRGRNGRGKTTLLETPLASAFRSFPSRPNRKDRNIVDYAIASDAYLACAFDLEGRGSFRIRLSIDGPKRKSSAVLVYIAPDGVETPLNDGKLPGFDTAIAQLLPPEELFLASVFGAQTLRGSFVTLEKAERKELFATLLGLGHLEEMAQRAKRAEKACVEALVPLRAARQVLARDADPSIETTLADEANALQVAGGRLELQRIELQARLTMLEQDLAQLQDAAATHASVRSRRDAEAAEHARLVARRDTAERELAQLRVDETAERARLEQTAHAACAAIERSIADRSELDAAVAAIRARAATTETDLRGRIAKNRQLLDAAEDVREAVTIVADAKRGIEARQGRERELRAQRDIASRRERVLADALAHIDATARDLERARAAAARITAAPFQDRCAPCAFMQDAAAAQASIAGLEEAIAARPAAEAERQTVLAQLTAVDEDLARIAGEIAELQLVVQQHQASANNAEHLTGAEQRIRDYEQQLEGLAADVEAQMGEAEARERRRVDAEQTRLTDRREQLARDLGALADRTARQADALTRTVSDLHDAIVGCEVALAQFDRQLAETADAAAHAARTREDLQTQQRAWDASTAALADVTARREALDRRRAHYLARRTELQQTDARIAALEQHRAEWLTLARACARDGLQTIEIDEAGPTVAGFTNDILRACYGPRFSVEIVTQEDRTTKARDGSMTKETFELKVYDAERGGPPRDLAELSGGEKVIVDEALKSAIALLVNTRNVHPIRTCWRDETTGPLDAENRERYLAMLRRVHELGEFHQTYFVTHDDEAADQADAQLLVTDAGVEVRLPPYRRAEAAA